MRYSELSIFLAEGDVAHGVFYLIWDNYFGIPLAVAVLMLAVLMGYVVFAMYAIAERDNE